MDCCHFQKFIQLYLDCELDGEEQQVFKEHFHNCPTCQDLLYFQQNFKTLLKSSCQPGQAPQTLKRNIRQMVEGDKIGQGLKYFVFFKALPAAVAAMLIIAFAWTFISVDRQNLIDESVKRHTADLAFDMESEDSRHLSHWLSKNLKYAVKVPDFTHYNLKLRGARLSYINNTPVAQVIYQSPGGNKTTLLLYPPEEITRSINIPFRQGRPADISGREKGYNVILWREGHNGYSLVSDMEKQDMIRLINY